MPKTVKSTCIDIMEYLKAEGVGPEAKLYLLALEKFIKRWAGADPRTVKAYIKYLEEFEFVKRDGEVFTLNYDKVEELMI